MTPEVWSIVAQLGEQDVPVSLKNSSDSLISINDYSALRAFEKSHSALYHDAIKPFTKSLSNNEELAYQMAAFNWVFKHYKEELNMLMDMDESSKKPRHRPPISLPNMASRGSR